MRDSFDLNGDRKVDGRSVLASVDEPRAAPPPVFAQRRLLLADQNARLHGATPLAYNIVECRRLLGRLDRHALHAALDGLVARHVVLRTVVQPSLVLTRQQWRSYVDTFGRTSQCSDELFVQTVVPAGEVRLRCRDLRAADRERQQQILIALYGDETRVPFDLSTAPLLRAHLHQHRDDEHVLTLCIPHYAIDALSINVCWRDLIALYEAETAGVASSLPPITCDFHAITERQRARYDHGEYAALMAYWQAQWARLSPATSVYPDDLDFVETGSHSVATATRTAIAHLEPAAAAALRQAARQRRVSPSVVFLAGFIRWLQLHTGRSLLAPWVVFSNRLEPGTEDVVGMLANAHALPVDIDSALSGHELLRRCRDSLQGALLHQALSLHLLWNSLGRKADGSTRMVFNYISSPPFLPRDTGLTVQHVPEVSGVMASYSPGFEVRVFMERERFVLCFLYAAGRFTADKVGAALNQYKQIVTGLMDDPDAAVGTLG